MSDFYAQRRATFAAMMAKGTPRAEVKQALDLTSGQYDSLKQRWRARQEKAA